MKPTRQEFWTSIYNSEVRRLRAAGFSHRTADRQAAANADSVVRREALKNMVPWDTDDDAH